MYYFIQQGNNIQGPFVRWFSGYQEYSFRPPGSARLKQTPLKPHRELLDDLPLLQAGLQTAYELNVLWPGCPLPWLLSGIFQSVSSRHAVNPCAAMSQPRGGRCGHDGDDAVCLAWLATLCSPKGKLRPRVSQ